jgi:hypothetical protein
VDGPDDAGHQAKNASAWARDFENMVFEHEIQLYWPAVTTNNAQKGDAAAPAW